MTSTAARIALVLATVTALAQAAAAQSEPIGEMAAPGRPAVDHSGDKSETTALALSVGGTVASWSLLIALPYAMDRWGAHPVGSAEAGIGITAEAVGAIGAVLAPSFGHWYAGGGWTRGLTLRVAGLGVAAAGLGVGVAACLPEGECDGAAVIGVAAAIGGGALFLAGTIHDFIHVRDRVRERNARRAVVVAPTPMPGGAGLVVAGAF